MPSLRGKNPLRLDRRSILARRLTVGGLGARLPAGRRSLRRSAWAGLQDSAPRAALLSLYARVERVQASAWEDSSLVQLWGPRRAVYVVPERDRALFSLGTLQGDPDARRSIEALAARLRAALAGRRMSAGDAARAVGVDSPTRIKFAGATGTIVIRWDGAREPTVWAVEPPEVDPKAARLELARRYLHILGPGTARGFARWAGIAPAEGDAAFDALDRELVAVRTPTLDAWILARDETELRDSPTERSGPRLLPSGDVYLLAEDRELLLADPNYRRALWPPSDVWPGGVLVSGELAGTWRRAQGAVSIRLWRRLSRAERDAAQVEAAGFPLPGLRGPVSVKWTQV
jgi:hypothetical protein